MLRRLTFSSSSSYCALPSLLLLSVRRRYYDVGPKRRSDNVNHSTDNGLRRQRDTTRRSAHRPVATFVDEEMTNAISTTTTIKATTMLSSSSPPFETQQSKEHQRHEQGHHDDVLSQHTQRHQTLDAPTDRETYLGVPLTPRHVLHQRQNLHPSTKQPLEKIHDAVQRNHLHRLLSKDKSTKRQPYRCGKCFHVSTHSVDRVDISTAELTDRLHKRDGAVRMEVKRLQSKPHIGAGGHEVEKQRHSKIRRMMNSKSEGNRTWFEGSRCPKCGSNKLKWLPQYAHEVTHVAGSRL
eukprot:PhM_4_TR17743/c0_g1_i1/m.3655